MLLSQKLKTLFSASLCAISIALPTWAHDGETHLETAHPNPTEPIECRCESDAHDQHHHESDHNRAFIEGTQNVFSPHSLPQDKLMLGYTHNFFWATLPRGSHPAFWLKYGILDRLQVDIVNTLRSPLEIEAGLSYQILDEFAGDWLSLTPRLSFNSRGTVVGAEISASRFILPDIWELGLDARVISSGAEDGFTRPVAALGLNTMVRVWKHWHLFGDIAVPLDGEILQQKSVLWSTGFKKVIPDTPHILSIYVGNTQEQTLSGRTISPGANLDDNFRLGFSFTIGIPEISQLPARLF